MAQAGNVVKASLSELKSQYAEAAAAVKTSTQNMADAQKQLGAAAAAGNAQAAAVIREYQQAQEQAAASAQALAGAVKQAQADLLAESVAATEATTAVNGLGAAHTRTVSEIQATGAAIRVAMGGESIRAVERFASNVLGLGPIMQAAFPIFGAIAFAEILGRIVDKTIEWYQALQHVSKEEADAFNNTQTKALERQQEALRQQQEAHLKLIEETQGKSAADSARIAAQQAKVNQLTSDAAAGAKRLHDQLADANKPAQSLLETISKIGDQMAPKTGGGLLDSLVGASSPIGAGRQLFGAVSEAMTAARQTEHKEMGAGSTQANTAALLAEQRAAHEELLAEQAKFHNDQVAEVKRAAAEAAAAARAATEALRKSDEDALADMKASHELTLTEEIAFWQKRMAVESGNSERLREIKRTLGNLFQQQDKEEQRQRVENENAAAEALTRGGGQADYATQLDYWNGVIAELRNKDISSGEEWKNAQEKIQKAGAENLKQIEEDLVRADKRGMEEMQAQHAVTAQAQVSYWSAIVNAAVVGSQRYEEALRSMVEAEKKANEERRAAMDEELKMQSEVAIQQLNLQKIRTQGAYAATGTGSVAEAQAELEALKNIDEEILQEKLRTAARMAAIDVNDPKKEQQDVQQMIQITNQMSTLEVQTAQRSAQLIMNAYKKAFQEISQDFTRAIDQWMEGHEKFSKAMAQMWNQMVMQFANSLMKMGIEWLQHLAMKAIANAVSNQTQVAQDATAAAQKGAISSASTMKEVTQDAVKAASGAYAAVAGIPFIGPILAPIAAATAFAGVEALGALAAFETGGIVPRTGIAMLHEGEQVTNRPLTTMLTNIANNGGASTGGNNSFHYSPQIAGNADEGMLKSHSRNMNRMFQMAMKRGRIAMPRGA